MAVGNIKFEIPSRLNQINWNTHLFPLQKHGKELKTFSRNYVINS
jgi:hypothetical protein